MPASEEPTTTSSAPLVRVKPARPGQQAATQVEPRRPRELTLPGGAPVPVLIATTGSDGLLELPADVRKAGWWDGSARLGDPLGSIVIAAHVDSLDQGLGVFAQLLSAEPGDRVTLRAGAVRRHYTITTAHLMAKTRLTSTSPLYSAPSEPRLVLITCGGEFDPARGGYQDNFVVIATPDAGDSRP